MTESEWLGGDDPGFLLDYLEGKVSDRKLWLFAVGCCRRMWHLLTDERSRNAVNITEQYAEGRASANALQAALELAGCVDEENETGEPTPAAVAWLIARPPAFDAAYACGHISVLMDRESMKRQPDWWATHEREGEVEAKHQANLLRCIMGNPFRSISDRPGRFAPKVIALAEAIYEERTFERLPALGHALEDAGCDNADIFAHCGGTGPHDRGCWVLDAVLGVG
jgi:hypothetical protein